MKRCEECGKELRILSGYQHPTLGKNHLICSPCFVKISESVARWRKFIISNSFNNASSRSVSQFNLKKIIPNIIKIRDKFDSKIAEKEIEIKR